jgi:hypothetical protein
LNGAIRRAVRVGGLTKAALLGALQHAGVELNEIGRTLFAHPGFTTAGEVSTIETVELAVADLAGPAGADMATILERADTRGLAPCPLELGPHLRLQYRDQPEGQAGEAPTRHRAPPGSITVVSLPLSDDEDVPKGFYLRRIGGALWLRGYRSGAQHVWSAHDRLLFRTRRAG